VGSNVDWCERNFEYSRYVAEMWNCLSSLPISAVALYGMVISRRQAYDNRICFAYFTVFIVGLGSAMFHGKPHGCALRLKPSHSPKQEL
jgi:dihydroceramidase